MPTFKIKGQRNTIFVSTIEADNEQDAIEKFKQDLDGEYCLVDDERDDDVSILSSNEETNA
jgi:hypothetical protein